MRIDWRALKGLGIALGLSMGFIAVASYVLLLVVLIVSPYWPISLGIGLLTLYLLAYSLAHK